MDLLADYRYATLSPPGRGAAWEATRHLSGRGGGACSGSPLRAACCIRPVLLPRSRSPGPAVAALTRATPLPPRSGSEPGSPGGSGDSGGGGTVTLLSKGVSAAPVVDTTGLALVDNRAVPSASTRMLLREWRCGGGAGAWGPAAGWQPRALACSAAAARPLTAPEQSQLRSRAPAHQQSPVHP